MGEFDLMLSFVSILFGIGYSKLLNAVPYVFSKNEKTSILYQLFFVYTFAAGIVHFWGFTNAIGNQDYNFNYFLCDVSFACFFMHCAPSFLPVISKKLIRGKSIF